MRTDGRNRQPNRAAWLAICGILGVAAAAAAAPPLRWFSDERAPTREVAWGDFDRDDDLDLAVANQGAPDQVYLNDNGNLRLIWESPLHDYDGLDRHDDSYSVAWADVDGDMDLDLAVGSQGVRIGEPVGAPNRLYLNNGDNTFTAIWESGQKESTRSVAWGDLNKDGKLDLAVGNRGYPELGAPAARNRIYLGDGAGNLSPWWGSVEQENTERLVWADFDDDGWQDLAVANDGQVNRIYRNQNGSMRPHWESLEQDFSCDLAVGYLDGDRFPDLAVANRSQPDRVYLNDGTGRMNLVWSSDDTLVTLSAEWGDYDGDGDDDVVFGTGRQGVYMFRNDAGALLFDQVIDEREVVYSIDFGQFDLSANVEFVTGGSARPIRLY